LFPQDDKQLHLYYFSSRINILRHAGFDKVENSPDSGIIEPGKKLADLLAAIPLYLINVHPYNSLEKTVIPKS